MTKVILNILVFPFLVCQSQGTPGIVAEFNVEKCISRLNIHKSDFGILQITKMSTSFNRLALYGDAKCGFDYESDSIQEVSSYVIQFEDASNTQVDFVRFKSARYLNAVSRQLRPLVDQVRAIQTKEENRNFCLPFYLSRIYNCATAGDYLVLFGYDAGNVSAENIDLSKLRYLDKVCNEMK